MAIVRTFVALELPETLQRELDKISVRMQRQMKELPIRWVRIQNIHLTLKFIGETKAETVTQISSVIEEQAKDTQPFEIGLGALGMFPNAAKPLVLWVGIQAPDVLTNLQQRIEAGLTRIGIPVEERPFHPHLTLGRVRRDHRLGNLRRIAELWQAAQTESTPSAKIDSVTLFRSDLKPGGSVYNPLSRSPLSGL